MAMSDSQRYPWNPAGKKSQLKIIRLILTHTWSDKACKGAVVNLFMKGHLKLRLQPLKVQNYGFKYIAFCVNV